MKIPLILNEDFYDCGEEIVHNHKNLNLFEYVIQQLKYKPIFEDKKIVKSFDPILGFLANLVMQLKNNKQFGLYGTNFAYYYSVINGKHDKVVKLDYFKNHIKDGKIEDGWHRIVLNILDVNDSIYDFSVSRKKFKEPEDMKHDYIIIKVGYEKQTLSDIKEKLRHELTHVAGMWGRETEDVLSHDKNKIAHVKNEFNVQPILFQCIKEFTYIFSDFEGQAFKNQTYEHIRQYTPDKRGLIETMVKNNTLDLVYIIEESFEQNRVNIFIELYEIVKRNLPYDYFSNLILLIVMYSLKDSSLVHYKSRYITKDFINDYYLRKVEIDDLNNWNQLVQSFYKYLTNVANEYLKDLIYVIKNVLIEEHLVPEDYFINVTDVKIHDLDRVIMRTV